MQEAVQSEVQTLWYVIPGMYEKWRHPSNKNDKHYRAIFRSNKHGRRVSRAKFKRAFDAQVYAARFDLRVCRRLANAV
jgi:hypothetical protein